VALNKILIGRQRHFGIYDGISMSFPVLRINTRATGIYIRTTNRRSIFPSSVTQHTMPITPQLTHFLKSLLPLVVDVVTLIKDVE
jgi:hypothetical protein